MNILDKIGMSIFHTGYYLWEEAIEIFKNEMKKDKINIKDKKYYVTKLNMEDIYKELAKKHNMTRSAVEKDMRTAMNKIEDLKEKLDTEYKITNKKFLILLLQKYGGKK